MASAAHGSAPVSPFGVRLRQWRHTRSLSQLDLATRAGSTARHVSFLETGRSRPSRDMVLQLADVLDAHGQVIATNRACSLLFGPDLAGTNMIERYVTDTAARDAIVNWPEVAWAGLARLRKQLHRAPLDARLRALVGLAEAAVANLPRPEATGQHGLVACPWFRIGDTVIRTVILAAQFDTAVEVTLDELRIELIYPLDAVAERFFRQHAR